MGSDRLAHVQAYYEALNRGDADEVASFFTDDATHYYTRLGPHRGRQISENAALGVKHLDADGSTSTASTTATKP
jgi:ketosteroid isomerase-like protein